MKKNGNPQKGIFILFFCYKFFIFRYFHKFIFRYRPKKYFPVSAQKKHPFRDASQIPDRACPRGKRISPCIFLLSLLEKSCNPSSFI